MTDTATQLQALTAELLRLSECAKANAETARTNPEQYVAAVSDHFLQLIPMVADVRKSLPATGQQPAEPVPEGSVLVSGQRLRKALTLMRFLMRSFPDKADRSTGEIAAGVASILQTELADQPVYQGALDAAGAPQEPMQVFSIDGEDYAYEDFADLLAQLHSIGELFVGRGYSVGTGIPVTPAALSEDLASSVDDYLADILCDRVGEHGEDALEKIDQDAFANAVEPLIAKAFTGRCWCVEDSEDRAITAEDLTRHAGGQQRAQ